MEPEFVLEWFRLGDGELMSAKHLTEHHPKQLEVICYLCQQASEKYLKAFLVCATEEEPPRTHVLETLCDCCAKYDSAFDTIYQKCQTLTPYAVQTRYPDTLELLESDMDRALRYANEIKRFAPLMELRMKLEDAP